ncbi:hypothetical protein MuM162_p19 [Shewanella phage vB_SspM_MuM16-2]|nr:hypothetical protein MuM162_p19 [Shewanella phage vB_SspM_MuM16-2]
MMKKFILLMALISSPLMAGESDWVKNDELNAFTSLDIVSGNVSAMIKPRKDGVVSFGLFLPYTKCYVAESHPEPFGSLIVVGGYEDFQLQCLGKNQAVIFPDISVSSAIIDTLIRDGNVCLTLDATGESMKMCFSGKGVKELKELANKK